MPHFLQLRIGENKKAWLDLSATPNYITLIQTKEDGMPDEVMPDQEPEQDTYEPENEPVPVGC